jgi:hypothetical protein
MEYPKNHTFVQLGRFPVIHKIMAIHSSAWGKSRLPSLLFGMRKKTEQKIVIIYENKLFHP